MMVDVISPKEKWYVKIMAYNEDCPHLCYPANYHGCKHQDRYNGGDIGPCEYKKCPIRTFEERKTK
jgi:hypothetical protein